VSKKRTKVVSSPVEKQSAEISQWLKENENLEKLKIIKTDKENQSPNVPNNEETFLPSPKKEPMSSRKILSRANTTANQTVNRTIAPPSVLRTARRKNKHDSSVLGRPIWKGNTGIRISR